jgi:8-oxo-dGTP pyrophosphatase MutT (NUDIX family)
VAEGARNVRRLLAGYLARHPEEASSLEIGQFLADFPNAFLRECVPGHMTASALVVDASGQHALLLYHTKLKRWLQPGGHADGDTDLAAVAMREVAEEVGLKRFQQPPALLDVDIHWIPARQGEPSHRHYDLRFLLIADGSETVQANHESQAVQWFPLAQLAEANSLVDGSIRRMARKVQNANFVHTLPRGRSALRAT